MLYVLPGLPLVAGMLLACSGAPSARLGERSRRLLLGAFAVGVLVALGGLALWVVVAEVPPSSLRWGGGLALELAIDPVVRVAAVLVPAIAVPVVLWAAAHEEALGLPRLLGGLVAFAGAMELLVLASDLVSLIVGWELVGALSFLLIAHRFGDDRAVGSASYAFNATRVGGLGLFAAAGAALAGGGSFAFEVLPRVAVGAFGDLFAGGVLLAAASKSAQVPFSPWLFRAMEGPSSVSALLHSSTMVAAGAWVLIRLQPSLELVPWFGPVAVAVGLGTAVTGGAVAAAQGHAKRLLAASTSAQYGLMFAAVGAGSAGAALAHLVTHAALKALLFLVAGTAIALAGSSALARMRLGRALPFTAAASAIGALALAAVPPLGAAWSKEQIVAATGQHGAALALTAIAAGGLGAFYATRFHLLAFGRGAHESKGEAHRPGVAERAAFLLLAGACIALSALWAPSVHEAAFAVAGVAVPQGKPWELPASVAVVLAAAGAGWLMLRRGRATSEEPGGARAVVADWLGLPGAIDALVTRPSLALASACASFERRVVDGAAARPALAFASACARFDDRVVDAGVRGCAWLGRAVSDAASRLVEAAADAVIDASAHVALFSGMAGRLADDRGFDSAVDGLGRVLGRAGSAARRLQTGAVPFYYALAIGGLFAVTLLLWLGRE